ncbi:hypothetical protein FNH22_13325 [Fulvivirga sp. M361]|uniref:hypothetical protein n=1 Tax=Fulvivirga sp. M361 TaxID=2594266 RepID=UPI00117B5D1F|nr:hypothetical protein [Fulvivirga sp. M361]TRX58850.1 hypothetical protein FNH22_13325 [Fulvivirga sp. M361]
MKIGLTILILTSTLQLSAQNWELVYHNDTNGQAVEGNIQNLINAIRTGKEVRIAWGFQHPNIQKISVEHLSDAAFLTIQSDSIVHAQIRPITGQSPDFDEGAIRLKENLEWTFIGGTNGKMDRMTRNVISGEIIEHKLGSSSFKWYVKK